MQWNSSLFTSVSLGQRDLNKTKTLSKNAGLESQAKNSQIKIHCISAMEES